MLVKDDNQQHWWLHVPDEHCLPGLEVEIVATDEGLKIGGELIEWSDLAKAKLAAQQDMHYEHF